MGVPSFYRWLIGKYPKIVQKAIEVPESSGTEPNPNGIEFDNLYLDMNCIIHECFHPEDQVPPKTYDEVFRSVFEYTDRIINIVRPRRLLYISVDGVTPRAKMNRQRAGRFFSTRSAEIAELEEDRLREEFNRFNKVLMPKKRNYNEVSDANVITPGTVFMERLSKALEYYVRSRLNSDPAWMNLKVILSDANVPGEGEHKMMSFIRAQRSAEGYNPNLRHCLYGLDADLIMLALSTHEINFFILREEFSNRNQSTVSSNFAQGLSTNLHEAIISREWYKKVIDERETVPKKPYEFVNICILREYLEIDLSIDEFKVETERIVDDFIFICFFMGNDFLPNIPSLEAHERALDLLIEVYKKTLKQTGGYLIDTAKIKDKKHAYLKISRVEKFMMDVGSYEEKVFLKRTILREKKLHMFSRELSEGDTSDTCFNDWGNCSSLLDDNGSSSGRTTYNELDVIKNTSELRRRLNDNLREKQDTYKSRSYHNDKIRLGYPGWKVRFYQEKFSAENSTELIENTRETLVEKYMEGLCWVLQYYFVGVCSWTWFYPFHYAPFASDLKNLSAEKINFKIGRPLKPFDQLMAVLPPKSSAELPRCYADLMNCKDSPISKFYPEGDIEIDMAGKRFLWQGIMKLPFIEEELLLASTKILESNLQVDEIERNSFRNDKIFVRRDTILGLKLDPSSENLKVPIDFASCEISGVLCSRKGYQDSAVFSSPIGSMEDIKDDFAVSAEYLTPVVDVPVFRLLENTEVPEKTIHANDVEKRELWHEWSSSGKPSTRNVHSDRSEYRKNTNSAAHMHEVWRCAGSGWSGSTGNYVGAHETFNPRESTVVCASSSGSGRGSISPGGNAAFPGGTHGQQGDGTSAGLKSVYVGAKPDWAGRGQARNWSR